jgi:hypothetical protein
MTRRTLLSLTGVSAAAYAQQKSTVGIGFIGISHSHGEGKSGLRRTGGSLELSRAIQSCRKLSAILAFPWYRVTNC